MRIKEVFASTRCASKSPKFIASFNSGKRMLALSGVGFAVVMMQVFGDTAMRQQG